MQVLVEGVVRVLRLVRLGDAHLVHPRQTLLRFIRGKTRLHLRDTITVWTRYESSAIDITDGADNFARRATASAYQSQIAHFATRSEANTRAAQGGWPSKPKHVVPNVRDCAGGAPLLSDFPLQGCDPFNFVTTPTP